MRLYLLLAVRNIIQARRRSLMMFTALGLVSMFLVMLLTLAQGINDTMIRSVSLLVSGHVNVAGYYKTGPGEAAPLLTDLARVRGVVQASTPELLDVIDRQRVWAKVISDNSNVQVGLTGIDPTQETHLLQELSLARESDYREGGGDEALGDLSHFDRRDGIILFAWHAKRLGVGVGDLLTISAQTLTGTVNTAEVEVVAVAKDLGYVSRWVSFVHKQVVQDMIQASPNTTGTVMLYLKDPTKATEAMMTVRDALGRAGFSLRDYQAVPAWHKFVTIADEDWRGEKLDLSTWGDEMGKMRWSLHALNTISVFLVTLLLLLVTVGLINGMWMAVRERTQEVGTLRAMGMARRRILSMFVVETGLLGTVAATSGSLLAAALAGIINALHVELHADALQAILMTDTLHLSVRAVHLLGAVALFALTTVVASLWPAMRAARMQPVTAIAHIN